MSMIQKQISDLKSIALQMESQQWKHTANIIYGAIDTIETLSAKMQVRNINTGWIPCSVRLPECEDKSESKGLLFQTITGSIEAGYYGRGGFLRDEYFRTYRDSYEGMDAKYVVAWMPLPEPYHSPVATVSEPHRPTQEELEDIFRQPADRDVECYEEE